MSRTMPKYADRLWGTKLESVGATQGLHRSGRPELNVAFGQQEKILHLQAAVIHSSHFANADFDILRVLQQIDQFVRVCLAVVIWVQNLRLKRLRRIGDHFRRHRIR